MAYPLKDLPPEEIPPQHRAVARLAACGYSVPEIAAAEGLSREVVRLALGRPCVRQLIETMGALREVQEKRWQDKLREMVEVGLERMLADIGKADLSPTARMKLVEFAADRMADAPLARAKDRQDAAVGAAVVDSRMLQSLAGAAGRLGQAGVRPAGGDGVPDVVDLGVEAEPPLALAVEAEPDGGSSGEEEEA